MGATDTEQRTTKTDDAAGKGTKQRAAKKRPGDDNGPVDVLVVPAKPALITVANLTTLAGTAAWVAGGPVGLVAAAAVTGVGTVAARRAWAERTARRRAAREAAAGTAGSAAGSSAGGRSRSGPGRRGGGPGTGGASNSGTGRRRGVAGMFRSRRGGAGGAGNGGGGSGPGGPGAGTRGGRSDRAGGGGLGRFFRRRNSGGGHGPGGGTTSAAGRAARAAGRGTRRALKGAAAGTYRGARAGYRKARQWTRKKILGKTPAGTAGAAKPCVQTTKPPAAKAQRPPGSQPPAPAAGRAAVRRASKPGSPVSPPGRPHTGAGGSTSVNGGTAMGLLDEARNMYGYAAQFEPKGMLGPVEPGGDLADMPVALDYVRATIGTYMEKAQARWPLDPAVAQVMSNIVGLLNTAAVGAREVKAAVEAMHQAELNRLRQPRSGEEKWDVTANR